MADKGSIKPTVPGTMDLVPSAVKENWQGDPRTTKKTKPRTSLWVRLTKWMRPKDN